MMDEYMNRMATVVSMKAAHGSRTMDSYVLSLAYVLPLPAIHPDSREQCQHSDGNILEGTKCPFVSKMTTLAYFYHGKPALLHRGRNI